MKNVKPGQVWERKQSKGVMFYIIGNFIHNKQYVDALYCHDLGEETQSIQSRKNLKVSYLKNECIYVGESSFDLKNVFGVCMKQDKKDMQ